MKKDQIGKFRKRLVKESVLKSIFLGLIFGCFALVIVGFFTWLFGYKPGLFLAIAALVVVTAIVAPLFYFLRFRPSTKEIACRVDALGLEERMLTMTELEGEQTYIAEAQREDTFHALEKMNHMMLKLAISAVLIVCVSFACLLGIGMTTVSSLYYAGVIPSGFETFTPEYIPQVFTVSYAIEEGGEGVIIYWTGDWSHETPVEEGGERVTEGEDARAVLAIPADEWLFVSWSDGVRDPYRQEVDVDGDVYVEAIFEPIEPDPEEGEEDNGEGGSQPGEGQEGDQQQQGEPQEGSEGEGEQGEQQQQPPQEPSGDPSNSAGGMRDMTSQQVDNGNTYYGDVFDDAYQQALDRLSQDNNIPDDLKQHVKDYYDSIETGSSDSGSGNWGGSGDIGGDEDQGGSGDQGGSDEGGESSDTGSEENEG